MTSLRPEQRERCFDGRAEYMKRPIDEKCPSHCRDGHPVIGYFGNDWREDEQCPMCLLFAALAACERERDEAQARLTYWYNADGTATILDADVVKAKRIAAAKEMATLRAQVATLRPWAEFGSWAFEEFWHDAEPGDIEASDAQEKAAALGLLARTSEADAGATHAEGCEWQPGMAAEECCCFSPCKPPLSATAPDSEVQP